MVGIRCRFGGVAGHPRPHYPHRHQLFPRPGSPRQIAAGLRRGLGPLHRLAPLVGRARRAPCDRQGTAQIQRPRRLPAVGRGRLGVAREAQWIVAMIDASWLVFVVASLVLIGTPGQDMILVMSRSVAQGAAAGVVTAGGVSVGLVGHTILATLGLGAILRTSEWLFIALQLVGAAYLIYLAICLLRTKQSSLPIGARVARTLGRLFVDGAVSNLSNPKIAIFYFFFLPQFVSPSAQYPTLTVFIL